MAVGAWLWPPTDALNEPDRSRARIEATRTALTAAGGLGAALALLLAVRRQRSTEHALLLQDADLEQREITADFARLDANERRITELYGKAADQLGSEKAPVRLAGLYSLERLAQGNEDQRQTIINVLCAYLRMPFRTLSPSVTDQPNSGDVDRVVEELQVRLTAQEVLARHLLAPDGGHDRQSDFEFWGNLTLNLAGATLIHLDFTGCRLGVTSFKNAKFVGEAGFDRVTFEGDALFTGARFEGPASFRDTVFVKDSWFGSALFTNDARFGNACFGGDAWFRDAKFEGNTTWFRGVRAKASGRRTSVWPVGWALRGSSSPSEDGQDAWAHLVEVAAAVGSDTNDHA